MMGREATLVFAEEMKGSKEVEEGNVYKSRPKFIKNRLAGRRGETWCQERFLCFRKIHNYY